MAAGASPTTLPAAAGAPLAELAEIPWRRRTDDRFLRRHARIWKCWTLAWTVPFLTAAFVLVALEPLALPVALASLAHAWIIPELHAYRGASVLRRKGPRNEHGEPVAQGFLGDLLGHEARALQRATGIAIERGQMGVWLLGESGAVLFPPGARRVHCFCVRTVDGDLPPSDRVAHLLLALRTDEHGFATVANHSFAGAPGRVRRRLPAHTRRAFDEGRAAARSL